MVSHPKNCFELWLGIQRKSENWFGSLKLNTHLHEQALSCLYTNAFAKVFSDFQCKNQYQLL